MKMILLRRFVLVGMAVLCTVYWIFAQEFERIHWESQDGKRDISLIRIDNGSKDRPIMWRYQMHEPFVEFDMVALHFNRQVYLWRAQDIVSVKNRYVLGEPQVEYRVRSTPQQGLTPPHLERPLAAGGTIRMQGSFQRVRTKPTLTQQILYIDMVLPKRVLAELKTAEYIELHLFDSTTNITEEAFILTAEELKELQAWLLMKE
ncbi:hypothetical protein PVA45_04655 [Entomospira entomophila]|uniref:Uncharacterized protein n=1 Tax=Entomospira entomophila TaxID=2719988 RepID=A0A968GA93_9SPIO|nr:hypothetical protein [Entomospira entomophilus]NIZ40792.1 hypothetical protein [Entomospira entomophilus]WDI35005.1 hypothetical protein PVA45_04655 [Entomospira entomophilus]